MDDKYFQHNTNQTFKTSHLSLFNEKFNFRIQLDKCEFLRMEVQFLGHTITPAGIKPNPDKIKIIIKFPIPKTQKEINTFLGLLGYCRKLIVNFVKVAQPLKNLVRK